MPGRRGSDGGRLATAATASQYLEEVLRGPRALLVDAAPLAAAVSIDLGQLLDLERVLVALRKVRTPIVKAAKEVPDDGLLLEKMKSVMAAEEAAYTWTRDDCLERVYATGQKLAELAHREVSSDLDESGAALRRLIGWNLEELRRSRRWVRTLSFAMALAWLATAARWEMVRPAELAALAVVTGLELSVTETNAAMNTATAEPERLDDDEARHTTWSKRLTKACAVLDAHVVPRNERASPRSEVPSGGV